MLNNLNHGVAVSSCGLLVNPSFPWLGASPDQIVFDPVEGSYGVGMIGHPILLRVPFTLGKTSPRHCAVYFATDELDRSA